MIIISSWMKILVLSEWIKNVMLHNPSLAVIYNYMSKTQREVSVQPNKLLRNIFKWILFDPKKRRKRWKKKHLSDNKSSETFGGVMLCQMEKVDNIEASLE